MKKIRVLSRAKFKEIINTININDVAVISIHSPNVGISFNDTGAILNSAPNILNLWFHDSDPEQQIEWMACDNPPYQEVLFDDVMARQIKSFVEDNLDKDTWLIHCTAGKCRSGAVGEVLSEYFEIPYMEFKQMNPQIQPNIWVKNVLKKVIYETK